VGTQALTLLVVGAPADDLPPSLAELAATRNVRVLQADGWRQACDPAKLTQADAVLVYEPSIHEIGPDVWHRHIQLLADALRSHRLTGIVLHAGPTEPLAVGDNALMSASVDATADELWGRMITIRQYQPMLRQMDEQVAVMQRLGKKLNQQFVEVDQELRLASRLQRDFLPRSFPEVDDVRFSAIYRPATWVSGDLYDVCRLDETHIGFYLADAVGHGIAAGLLTMFIKQAVVGKVIEPDQYRLLKPDEVLARLNVELARQELPNCQFVTACYACIDAATHQVMFARGGHPHPIHITADGQCNEVRTIGGLLGVFAEETFPSTTLKLERGDKLLLYSDGLEDVIVAGRDRLEGSVQFTPEFLQVAGKPLPDFLDGLSGYLDHTEGSLAPFDDMTALVVERSAQS